jgi:Putative phage tail protein
MIYSRNNDPLSMWMDRAFVRSDLIRRLRTEGRVGATRADDAVLPLVYGTARVPVQLLEKFAPTLQGHPAWTASADHSVGDYVITTDSGYWRCLHAGASLDVEPARQHAAYPEMARETAYAVGQCAWVDLSSPYPIGRYYLACVDDGTTAATDMTIAYYTDIVDGTCTWRLVGIGKPGGITDLVWGALRKLLPQGFDMAASDFVDGTCVWHYDRQYSGTGWRQTFLGGICEDQWDARLLAVWVGAKRYLLDARSASDVISGAPCGLLFRSSDSEELPAIFDACGYAGVIAIYSDAAQLDTGTQMEMPDLAVEVRSTNSYSSGVALPADLQPLYILTAPASDVGIAQRAGIDTEIVSWRDYPLYCSAAGLHLSLVVDQPTSALELIGRVLQATNTDAVWSGAKLKLMPLADATIATPVYGSTPYEPTNEAAYNLGPDDFLAGPGSPVEITRRAADDCYTRYTVSYLDRSQGYSEKKASYVDAAAIESGQPDSEASEISLGVIYPDATAPTMIAQALAQRSAYSRNSYRFRLSWRYALLEPTDIVTLTEPAVGLDLTPVRIVDVSETADGYEVIAEDWPNGIAVPGGYRPQIGDGLAPDEPSSLASQVSVFDGYRQVVDHRVAPITSAAINHGSLAGELWPNNGFELWSPESARGTCAPDGWQTISIQRSDDSPISEHPYAELLVTPRSGELTSPPADVECTRAGQRIWGNYVSMVDNVGVLGDTAIALDFPAQDVSEVSPDLIGILSQNWIPARAGLEFTAKLAVRRRGGDYASDYVWASVFFAVVDDRDRTDYAIVLDNRGIAMVPRDTLVTETRVLTLDASDWSTYGEDPVWMRAGIMLYRDGASPLTSAAHGVDIVYASLTCTTPFV